MAELAKATYMNILFYTKIKKSRLKINLLPRI